MLTIIRNVLRLKAVQTVLACLRFASYVGKSNWKNAWRIRIVALGCIVTLLGAGSQVLVHAFAATSETMTLEVTAYTLEGRMADGNYTYLGACAVSTSQFPFGTVIALYNADGSLNRECTAEDTGGGVGYGHIDLAMPGDSAGATQWGVRYLLAQVLRWGWGGVTPSTPISSPVSPNLQTPIRKSLHSHSKYWLGVHPPLRRMNRVL